jgi:phage shock protein PspC (stress-responsive transcriptional regulator)
VRTQLRRSRTNKMIGGVSGGLAEYSGIDALLFRVGFVALALAGGSGILVYLLLWLLMPAGSAAATDPWPQGAAVGASSAPAVRKRPPGPRSPVPRITIALLLIVVGALVLFSRFGGWDLGPQAFFGSALLIVGLGLVAAAFSPGRTARGGLITLGVILSFALIAATAVPWDDVRDEVGDRTFSPRSAAAVLDEYHGALGDLRIDLSDVDVSDLASPVRTHVDGGLGDVEVVVPADADVRVDVETGMGSVEVFDEPDVTEGFFEGRGVGSWVADGEAEIVLTVNGGAGDVEVSRA